MQGWRDDEAAKAAVMLRTCTCLAEDTMQDHIPILLPALCKVRLIGEKGMPGVWLVWL